MQYDYCASLRAELSDILESLKRAAREFEAAQNTEDKKARKEARKRAREGMKQAAEETANVEPHLSYIWFEAFKQEAENKKNEEGKAIFSVAENAIQDAWKGKLTVAGSTCDMQQHQDFCRIPDKLKFSPCSEDLHRLPVSSFLFVIPFRLRKPYLSKNESDFYLLDNPLRREKVFKTPIVAATGWKGVLRSAMVCNLVAWWQDMPEDERDQKAEEFAARRFRLALLFGDEKGEEPGCVRSLAQYLDNAGGEKAAGLYRRKVKEYFSIEADKPMPHHRGRLYFFQTFFNQVGLEVINPHDRKIGVGARGPILMECVPQGTKGTFTLLYVPLGFRGGEGNHEFCKEVAQHLESVAKGVKAMLTEYGFGAKTSSGFGVAEDDLTENGCLAIRAALNVQKKTENDDERDTLPPDVRTREQLQDYLLEDGSLKTLEEYKALMEGRGQKWGKRSKKRFNNVKEWFEQRKKQTREAVELQEAGITRISFSTLADFMKRAEEAAKALLEVGDEQ